MVGAWHYATRNLPGIGVALTLYDAYGNEIDEIVEDTKDAAIEKAKELAEEAGATLEAAAAAIANATLDVVRGLGGAIVDGLDSAYDAARAKLEGREPDVIAGIVVVALTVLTVTYIYHSAKVAGDAF
tara:strand:+ start:341 stop:724 length:384 start_codon:yes stop_codon:yes gene_type:complete